MRSDRSFYFVRVDVAGSRVDIHKDRFASFPYDAARGRHIGKWRGDDLSGKFHGFDRNLNGDGAVACIEQMVDTEVFLEAKFQFIDQRAIVSQPIALPNAIKVGLVFRLRGKEGLGDGDQMDFGFRISDFGFVELANC